MRKRTKFYSGALALAALAGVALAGIGEAWSYFTTYTEAVGGYTIELGEWTEIKEEFTEWTKHVVISNDAGSQPVYIRAKAFCGSQYKLVYSGEGWKQGSDGYYYYQSAVNGGSSTGKLDIKIENIPQEPEDKESINVVVIYESVPVKYYEDGAPYPPEKIDWSEPLDTGSVREGSKMGEAPEGKEGAAALDGGDMEGGGA